MPMAAGIFADALDHIGVMREALVGVVHAEPEEIVRAEELAGLRVVGVCVVGGHWAEGDHTTLGERACNAGLAPDGDIPGRRSDRKEARELGDAEAVEGICIVDDDAESGSAGARAERRMRKPDWDGIGSDFEVVAEPDARVLAAHRQQRASG